MPLKATIKDGGGSSIEAHVHQRNGDKGLVVFTEELQEKETLFSFALNPDLGFQMAIDASFSGTPEKIHNGTDSVEWAGSNITGSSVTFSSTDTNPPLLGSWPTSGTKSIKIDRASVNDVWEFNRGSSTSGSSWVAISMNVYIASGWTSGDSVAIYAYDSNTTSQVGDSVLIEDYINEFDFSVDQEIGIPLTDMNIGSSSFDAIRMEIVGKHGVAPVWYMDAIKLQETSGSEEFKVSAPTGTKYYVSEFKFTYIGLNTTTLPDGTMPRLTYNGILNTPKLGQGIGFARIKDGKTIFDARVTCLADSTRAGAVLENVYADNTTAHMTLNTKFTAPVLLDSRYDDSIAVTIRDDLSGLLSFTAVALGYTVDI